MTLVVFGLGALLCAAGTRLAAVAFGASAVLAAVQPGPASPAVVGTAVMAAALISSGVMPRRVAVPALGAAAAIAAGAAGNAAIVLALWTLGTAAAVSSRAHGRDGSRWAFALLQSDLLLAATVVYTGLTFGFASWPHRLGTVGAGVLLVSALVRVPAVGWPDEHPELGLLLVRAQSIVLMSVAVRAAGHDVLIAAAAAGAGLFALAVLARRDSVRDAVQEAGLVLLTLAATGLGWEPTGWTWGAVLGGTLTHQLRLTGRGRDEVSSLARAMERSGGIGLPLLPAVGAAAMSVLQRPGPLRVLILLALTGGLAGRTLSPAPELPATRGTSPRRWGEVVIAASGVASLVAAAVALPRPPGGNSLPWPSIGAAGFVVFAAIVGGALPGLAPAAEPSGTSPVVSPPVVDRLTGLFDPPGGSTVLIGLLCVLGALGVGILVLGWLRGFL